MHEVNLPLKKSSSATKLVLVNFWGLVLRLMIRSWFTKKAIGSKFCIKNQEKWSEICKNMNI